VKRKTPRERLAQHLRATGYEVEAEDIHGALGWYRIEQKYDDMTVCWEVWAVKAGESANLPHYLYSRSTMTDCARRGVEFGTPEARYVEVWPKGT